MRINSVIHVKELGGGLSDEAYYIPLGVTEKVQLKSVNPTFATLKTKF